MTTIAAETHVPPRPFADLKARDFSQADYWGAETVYTIPSVGTMRGRAAITAYFVEMTTAMPDLIMEVERVLEVDEVQVVQWNATGTFNGGPFQGVRATGRRLTFNGCDVIEWRNSVVRTNSVYTDGAHMARQIGLLPPTGSAAEGALTALFNGGTRLRRRVAR